MKVELQEKSPVEKQVSVEVEPQRYEKSLDKVLKQVGMEVTIPGFRKGKAPKAAILRRVGFNAIKKDFLETLVPELLADILKETNLQPISRPHIVDFEKIQLEVGEPLNFEMIFEVKPEFQLEGYKGLELTKIVRETNIDEMVDKQIENLREKMSTMVPIEEERPLQMGDVALVDFDTYKQDGEQIKEGTARDYYMTIDESNFIPGFIPNVIGKKAGEEFEFDVVFPTPYPNKDMEGQNIHFKMKLISINKKELPEVNDEFAKEIGDFDTIDLLKEDIRKFTENNIKTQQRNEMQEEAVKALVPQLDNVMVPRTLVAVNIERQVDNLRQQFQQLGSTLEQQVKTMGSDMEQLRRSFEPQAVFNAKAELVLDKIAQLESVQVTDEDIDKEIQSLAEKHKQPSETVKKVLQRDNFLPVIKYEIQGRKVFDIIIDNAIIVEKSQEEVAAERAEQEKKQAEMNEEIAKSISKTEKVDQFFENMGIDVSKQEESSEQAACEIENEVNEVIDQEIGAKS
jgi:trigger factor